MTERHTKADLECWAKYEELDSINSRSQALTRKEEKALSVLNDFKPDYCSISWGKDSTVLMHLSLRAGLQVPFVHILFKQENPDNFLVKPFWPNINYHEIYKPSLTWNQRLKLLESEFGVRGATGIRADESAGRRIRMYKYRETSDTKCAPIGFWSNLDVFAYLFKYKIPVHPVYGYLGGGRWPREHLRVDVLANYELGGYDSGGGYNFGRGSWESEYYPDIVNRIQHNDLIQKVHPSD